MNVDDFRRIALGMPEAVESAHMGHPDFRVRGRIFATIWPDDGWGMVKLTPEQQGEFVEAGAGVFSPVKGAWGERGATRVRLDAVRVGVLRAAITAAWRTIAEGGAAKSSGLVVRPSSKARAKAGGNVGVRKKTKKKARLRRGG